LDKKNQNHHREKNVATIAWKIVKIAERTITTDVKTEGTKEKIDGMSGKTSGMLK
jgi:phosphate uptake regulator